VLRIFDNKEKIYPKFDLSEGYRYTDVEEVIKKTPSAANELLEELYKGEILDRLLYDMEMRCPQCKSPNVSTRYICPSCGSLHIKKTILLEHFECGYLGPFTTFGEINTCPKCNAILTEGSYKNAGSIYECADCNKQIDTPFVNHLCREHDGYIFSFENSIYQPKYYYYPTQPVSEDMKRGIIFTSPIINILQKLGMNQLENASLVGSSGVQQVFDLAFERNKKTTYIDILQGSEPFTEMDVLREYGKLMDTKVEAYILISPGLEEKAMAMAKTYRLNVIDSSEVNSIYSRLETSLRDNHQIPTTYEAKNDQNTKTKGRWKI